MVSLVVIRSPLRLKLAVLSLFLSVPLVAIEVVMATRSPWWNLPLRGMGYWSLAYFLLCFPVGIWILSGKRWAYTLLWILLVSWIFASVSMAFKTRSPSLGFFSIFLAMLSWVELGLLRRELARSFFDPQLFWFQGLPKPIPGLKCRMASPGAVAEFDVSRLDRDGAFVYTPYFRLNSAPSLVQVNKSPQKLEFAYRDKKLACTGTPVVCLTGGVGTGFQFVNLGADFTKELGDFVETLRSEGHVEL